MVPTFYLWVIGLGGVFMVWWGATAKITGAQKYLTGIIFKLIPLLIGFGEVLFVLKQLNII